MSTVYRFSALPLKERIAALERRIAKHEKEAESLEYQAREQRKQAAEYRVWVEQLWMEEWEERHVLR